MYNECLLQYMVFVNSSDNGRHNFEGSGLWMDLLTASMFFLAICLLLAPPAKVTAAGDEVITELLKIQRRSGVDQEQARDISLLLQHVRELDMGYKLFEVFKISWNTLKALFTGVCTVALALKEMNS